MIRKSSPQRQLAWDGCFNARELGGLNTASGRVTRRGSIVRCDTVDFLTEAGWTAVHSHGVRTVIDLRNETEKRPDQFLRPSDLTTVNIALDGGADPDFWAFWGGGPRFCTPLYYKPHLERFPELSAAVVSAIANAVPGGVLVHCGAGRDRTGLIAMLLLALVGVTSDDIATDHALSTTYLTPPFYTRLGKVNENPIIEDFLAKEGTTSREILQSTLASLDVEAVLRNGGVGADELAAVRAKLLG